MAIVNSFNFGNERWVGMGDVSVRVQHEFYIIVYFFGGYVEYNVFGFVDV